MLQEAPEGAATEGGIAARLSGAGVGDTAYRVAITFFAVCIPILLLLIAWEVGVAGWPAFREFGPGFLASSTWDPVRGAVGYNVLWGIRPNKLYQTYQVFADRATVLELRALTVDQSYWVAIEAFDETGVSPPSAAFPLR